MWNKRFQGWYFKHQCENNTIAFIPGRAESGAFVQVISKDGSYQFDVPALTVKNGTIHAGPCTFSKIGCVIDLPGISGEIRYGKLTQLKSDIMGPFRFFPMQCRHGVISMAHQLSGDLTINSEQINVDGGRGYIEKDSGISFPRSYLWLQCNDFSKPCSLMLSIAHIPFAGMSFTGCICAIVWREREYRLATYNGVHIHTCKPKYIYLSQGKLQLKIQVIPFDEGHPLASPIAGRMSGSIRESHQASIHCSLWDGDKMIFDLQSNRASFEYVPE